MFAQGLAMEAAPKAFRNEVKEWSESGTADVATRTKWGEPHKNKIKRDTDGKPELIASLDLFDNFVVEQVDEF